MRRYFAFVFLVCALVVLSSTFAFSQRTPLKPGWNMFSAQQDVELGRQVSQDAEKSLPMLNNSRVDDYLNRLGRKLATKAPGAEYPYQFKCVNDSSINAFALPGGFLYVNRGTIEAADNEAELAGVIGHEIGHVALRHGTNQASKQYIAQVPLALLAGKLGSQSFGAIAAQLGSKFAFSSILLKYSRDDERQSDLMGAQILYDTNYDPRYMATFFEKLGSKGRGSDFFSSHPNPENRIQNINAEIGKLGFRSGGTADSSEFQSIRKLVKSLPPASNKQEQTQNANSNPQEKQVRPAPASTRLQMHDAGNLTVRYPENWKAYGENRAFTLAPDGGIVQVGDAESLAYGTIMSVYNLKSGNRTSLKSATDQLIQTLQSSNSAMRQSKDLGQIRVGGQSALSRLFVNQSPIGGRETDWLVTVLRPEGLVYFIFVAPENEFNEYQQSFRQVLNSVTFK